MTVKEQVDYLCELFNNATIAEIGCYLGETTKALAQPNKNNKVYAIDPFLGGYDDKDKISEMLKHENKIRSTFLKNIEGLNVVFIEKKGIDAYDDVKEELDGIFIDSLHTFEGVKEDSKWINKVKKGGLLCFHDYTSTFQGVKDFIDQEIIPNYELVKQIGTLMVFRK